MASACHTNGKRILLVDLDPQANLTSSFVADDQVQRSVERLFDPTIEPDAGSLVPSTGFAGVDL